MAKKKVEENEANVNECNTCDDKAQCPDTDAPAPPVTSEGGAAATPKPAAERQVMNANYRFIRVPGEGEKKLPLQANQILDILKGAGQTDVDTSEMDEAGAEAAKAAAPYNLMSRKDLLDRMKDVVVTRQPIERILGYYQPILTKAGYVSVEK